MAFFIYKKIARKGQNTPKSDFRRPIMPPQRCKLNIKHVVLYVGHLYKPFWKKFLKKKLTGLAVGGSRKVKIWPRKDPGNGGQSIRGRAMRKGEE